MHIVFFGLTITSAWGNGHATLLRALFSALHRDGHSIEFFERDVPYYAAHRDASEFSFATLHLYEGWQQTLPSARKALSEADAAVVTSYCPDGAAAADLVLSAQPGLRKIFYDMDTPVTLERLASHQPVPYLPATGLGAFDLVLTYTGGLAVEQLRSVLDAHTIATLYGWVDPAIYRRVPVSPDFASDLSYLATYSPDRQAAFEQLFLAPARALPQQGFVVGGAMYPDIKHWPGNVRYFDHVSPSRHGQFYSSAPLTLSTTRATMAAMGYCPSGRLFEAAACQTVVLSDQWTGLDFFFQPGEEILITSSATESAQQITRDRESLAAVAQRAYARTMECHTAAVRAARFIRLLEDPADDIEESLSGSIHLTGSRA